MKKLRIAVGHQARVGKDTFADYVNDQYKCTTVKFATKLYEITESIQRTLGVEVAKDPVLLQTIGDKMRSHYGEDIFVKQLVNEIADIEKNNPDQNIIITDLRRINEFIAVKNLGFITIRIIKPDRVIDRDPSHISEVDLIDCKFDYEIINDGTLGQFYGKINHILEQIEKRQ
jgi:hypothetical protein